MPNPMAATQGTQSPLPEMQGERQIGATTNTTKTGKAGKKKKEGVGEGWKGGDSNPVGPLGDGWRGGGGK